jgi:hypothetical protein
MFIVKCSCASHSLFWVNMLTMWIWCMYIILIFWEEMMQHHENQFWLEIK